PHLLCARPFVSFVLSFLSQHPAPTELYTLSLHDALPISLLSGEFVGYRKSEDSRLFSFRRTADEAAGTTVTLEARVRVESDGAVDRKSTRLNSSHVKISYAVFCLKKKKMQIHHNMNNTKE